MQKMFIKRSASNMVEQTKFARWIPRAWLECLIFILVYMVGGIVQALFLIVPMVFVVFSNPGFLSAIQYGDLGGAIDAVVYLIFDNPLLAFIFLFSNVAIIAAVLLYTKTIQKRSWGSLGLKGKRVLPNYLVGMAVGVGALVLVELVPALFGYRYELAFNGLSPLLLVFFAGYMIQTFAEELLCRGYLMNSVAARSNIPVGIITNSVVFALLHVLNPGTSILSIAMVAIYGVNFSLLAYITDDIWSASGMHFGWNFALSCILGSESAGMNLRPLFTLTATEPEGASAFTTGVVSLATIVVMLLISAVLIVLLVRKIQKQKKEVAAIG